MSSLASKSYVFDPRPDYPLLVTAKRYWIPDSPYLDDPEAYTLIFTHGTGFHKEQWEPTLDDLHGFVSKGNGSINEKGNIRIREMWAIDAPNHGEAAVLNEETLKWGYEPVFGWEEYGRAIHLFLAGLGTGVDVDFKTRRLIGIGHSMGAVCLTLALTYYPPIKPEAIILCELMTMGSKYTGKAGKRFTAGSVNRRDIWPSRDEAFNLLRERGAWKIWDKRVVRRFVEDGMRPLPSADYPDIKEGVTLKCTRKQETACYVDSLGMARSYNILGTIVKRFPTHMIYGAIDDTLSTEVKKDVVENAAGGVQNLASFARVEKAGHLIVQMNPYALANQLYKTLKIIEETASNTARVPVPVALHQSRL